MLCGCLTLALGCASGLSDETRFRTGWQHFDQYEYEAALAALEPVACGRSAHTPDALSVISWIAASGDWNHDGTVDVEAGADRILATLHRRDRCHARLLDHTAQLVADRGFDPALVARLLSESHLRDPLALEAADRLGRWVEAAKLARDGIVEIEALTTLLHHLRLGGPWARKHAGNQYALMDAVARHRLAVRHLAEALHARASELKAVGDPAARVEYDRSVAQYERYLGTDEAPAHCEVRFLRAEALRAGGRRDAAAAAYKTVLACPEEGPWREQARRRLAELP